MVPLFYNVAMRYSNIALNQYFFLYVSSLWPLAPSHLPAVALMMAVTSLLQVRVFSIYSRMPM